MQKDGIIDSFQFTMTTNEVIGKGDSSYSKKIMTGCEREVKEFINEISGEYPHTIKFFAIPDFSYGVLI